MSALITVAIPAYNRPIELDRLLSTVVPQADDRTEVLVVEDHSPRRDEICQVVQGWAARSPGSRIRFETNPQNLGYDGNIRRCLELAQGQFTMFMGDDDVLNPGAIARLRAVIEKHANLGVILRAYEFVDFQTGRRTEVFRYFEDDRFFPAGADTIRTFFRRSVSVAGFTVHTAAAREQGTDEFDGTLLYQLHVAANVLKSRDGYYVSDILTAMRKNDEQRHFFGSSKAEKGRFAPGALSPDHSVNFMEGMIRIARAAERRTGLPIYDGIRKDIGNYSYAFLRLHAADRRAFARYVASLARLGFGESALFWLYSAALFTVPAPLLDRGIRTLKRVLRSTPRLGAIYEGQRV
jgi:glycosyltransferase involved in cell wall biosynthesis